MEKGDFDQLIECPALKLWLSHTTYVAQKTTKQSSITGSSSEIIIFLLLLVGCMKAPYRGTPWQLNHFNVITLYQQQPSSCYLPPHPTHLGWQDLHGG